jgi:chaperonin GroEL
VRARRKTSTHAIAQIRAQIEKTTSDYDREKLQDAGQAHRRRSSHPCRRSHRNEMKERKDLIDDAVAATVQPLKKA